MKNKKCISPLIATVLIIGFTIVLAALVVTWGTGIFKGIQERTKITSEVSEACSTQLINLEIKGVEYTTSTKILKTIIDNRNNLKISKFAARIYDAGGNTLVPSVIEIGGLTAFEQKTDSTRVTLPTGVQSTSMDMIGIFPFVTASDGKDYQCSNEYKYKIKVAP